MKKLVVRYIFILLTTSISFLSTSQAQEPSNIYVYKQKLIRYHDSGDYARDQKQVATRALLFLKQRIAENEKLLTPAKLAIVFDIDETVLSNYAIIKQLRFGGSRKEIDNLVQKGHDPVIPATLKLYRYAIQHGVAIFFITGRPENMRAATIRNLHNVGFKKWKGLFLTTKNSITKSAIPYKSSIRKRLENKGYDIVLSIGDQMSDLAGGHAERTFKLPNPFYFLP